MKRAAMNHRKLKKLQMRLRVPLYATVGLLECLWHLTAREAPQGNIGRLPDEDIALMLEWDREPEELVAALVSAGWLDESPAHRLVVHDWHEHADDAVRVALKRSGKPFLSEQAATECPPVGTESLPVDTESEHVATCRDMSPSRTCLPRQSPAPPEPEESKPVAAAKSLARARANGGGDFEEISDSEEAAAAVLKANPNAVYRWIGAALTRKQREEWLAQIAGHFEAGRIVTAEHLDAAAAAAERDFRERGNGAKRTMGWFYTALKEVLNPAEERPPEPEAAPFMSRWRIVFNGRDRDACLAALRAARGDAAALEKARERLRYTLRLNGFEGDEIEEEAAEVEAAAEREGGMPLEAATI